MENGKLKIGNVNCFLVAAFALFLLACGSDKEKSPRETEIDKIKTLEAEMHKSMELKKGLADSTLKAYDAFVSKFPTDSLSPDLMFKGAEIATATAEYDRANQYYKNIISQFPKYKLFQESLFLQASLLDNYLNREGEAKMAYENIIYKFPKSPYVADAKAAIENLGKSDEEIMKMIKEKNQ
jgi:outer membrane protein assembly factor BamD (BamD/ComL family)